MTRQPRLPTCWGRTPGDRDDAPRRSPLTAVVGSRRRATSTRTLCPNATAKEPLTAGVCRGTGESPPQVSASETGTPVAERVAAAAMFVVARRVEPPTERKAASTDHVLHEKHDPWATPRFPSLHKARRGHSERRGFTRSLEVGGGPGNPGFLAEEGPIFLTRLCDRQRTNGPRLNRFPVVSQSG